MRESQHSRIGVFDSGVGGLTVLRELYRQLPKESILYFGDTARLPYGDRSPSEIIQFVREILTWMSPRKRKNGHHRLQHQFGFGLQSHSRRI